MDSPTVSSICRRHSQCHRRRSFLVASSSTCLFSPPPPLPSFTPHQQWLWHPRVTASGTPVSAYPARTTVAVAPTRCFGQLFRTTDSVKSGVVWSLAARVEGQPMTHSPTKGGRDHQRATGVRRRRAAQRWKSGSQQPVLVFDLEEVRCPSPILQDLRKNYYARRTSHHMLEASWLSTSGDRRCSLKRCMHCTHGSHALESVSFSSLLPLPLAMSLVPRHVPRTSPPHSPNASSTSQRHPSLRERTPPPCPPLPPSRSPCSTVRPRRRRMLQPEAQTSCSQSCRTSTWPEATTAEES